MTRLTWVVAAVAALMAAVTLVPAEVWNAPPYDAAYSGFDPNLTYGNGGSGGSVVTSRETATLTALSGTDPSLSLVVTPLNRLTASMRVRVLDNVAASEVLRVGVWSPSSGAGYLLVFGPSPNHQLIAETLAHGHIGRYLSGGDVTRSTVVGTYGAETRVTFAIDRQRGSARITATTPSSTVTDSIARADLADFFDSPRIALTAASAPGSGEARVELSNYSVTLPHERFWASKVDDWRVRLIVAILAIAGLALAVSAAIRSRPTLRLIPPFRGSAWVGGAIAVYLAGNALLFPLGGHPYDMAAEKVYAYVARAYGPAQLFYLPNVTTLAQVWGGVPYDELPFPYEPVTAYLSTAIGWLDAPFEHGALFDSRSLEYAIKAVNVLFGLGCAALIFLILRELGASPRWRWVTTGLFLFNPAVWFSMSVWGQTHVISAFFALACVLFIERRQILAAWLALFAACLTRPQMLVFGLILGVVLLRLVPWRETARALPWAVIVTFLAMLPLTALISPSLPVDVMLSNFRIQEAGGQVPGMTTVSLGAFSIWPLVTLLLHGASGVSRSFLSSSQVLVDGLTYQRVGQILTAAALLALSAGILVRDRRSLGSGGYLPSVALAITSFLMFLTGTVPTYFVLAIPFVLLCKRWFGTTAYLYIAVIWTLTTLVSTYGEMGAVISPQGHPLLAQENNGLTRLMVGLYTWDRFITLATIANLCALVWMAYLVVRPEVEPVRPQLAPGVRSSRT